MAKRMTDTSIWQKEWFMSLSPKLKCLTKFIWDNCDNSGVWSPNWLLASTMIGDKVCEADLSDIDNGNRYEILADGKVWIKDFITFQCGQTLSEKSRPHQKVIELLKNHKILDRVSDRVSNGVSDTPNTIPIQYNTNTILIEEEKNEFELDENLNLKVEVLGKKLLDDIGWREHLAMGFEKIKMDDSEIGIPRFVDHLRSQGEERKNFRDAKSHFVNWYRKNPNPSPKRANSFTSKLSAAQNG